jgi:chromosome segregation ATPase
MLSRSLAAASLGALLIGSMAAPTRAAANPPKTSRASKADDTYVISRGDHWVSTNASLEVVRAIQRRFSGTLLWIRRGGKEYLIRDRAILDEAQSLFAPLKALEPEQAALQERQAPLQSEEAALDREQEKLERELEKLEDDSEVGDEDMNAARRDIQVRQAELESRMRALEDQERELEAVERSLDEREEDLERRAEEELWGVIDRAIARGLARSLDRR